MRIVIAGMSHETNTFSPVRTDLARYSFGGRAVLRTIDDDVEAAFGEGQRAGAADVLVRSGDQRGACGARHSLCLLKRAPPW